MKKILSILSFLICSLAVFGQTIPSTPVAPIQGLGATGNIVDTRGVHAANAGFAWYGDFGDTATANLHPFVKLIAGQTIRTGDTYWARNSARTQWLSFGAGTTYVDTTQTIRLSGTGSLADPLVAHTIISQQPGNALDTLPDGHFVQSTIDNGLIRGGRIFWNVGLTYTVTPADYAIGYVEYSSPQTQVTLANSDPTFNRIDRVVATVDGTVVVITGTPSSDPQEPSYDATTQLPLGFIIVTAASTEPTYCRDSIYFPNNGQNWTAASGTSRINATSTTNPYSVTQDVEFTLARNNDQIRFTKGSAISIANTDVVAVQIRSKATWAATSRLSLRFYNVLTPLGNPVIIGNGIYGFNSSNTASYQAIVIPRTAFGVITGADNILITVLASGSNTIGLYLDDFELLGCGGTAVPITGKWSQGGDPWGTTGIIGTLDNFPYQVKTNNTNHSLFQVGGSIQLQGATPRVSFGTGTGAASDYFHTRTGTDLITNTAGGYITRFTGNRVYSFDKNNGHIWADSLATTRMQLLPTGALRLYAYGDNTFTGTATRWLAVDVDGNVIEQAPPATSITATNGLTMSTATNVVLGGTALSANTSIPTSAFSLEVNSSIPAAIDGSTFISRNSSDGDAGIFSANGGNSIYAQSTEGGIYTVSINSIGLFATSTNSAAISAVSSGVFDPTIYSTIQPSSTNTVVANIRLTRASSGSAANGIGESMEFYIENSSGGVNLSNQIISKLTDVTVGTRTSQFIITGVNNATTADIFTLAGNGALTLGAAYQGLGAGYLAVSNTGVVTWSAATGSMTNPMTTAGDIIYSSDGAGTPARLPIGTSGQVLRTSAGGIPEWFTTAGTGTVTSVAAASSGIFSYTGSPVTTSGTLTLVATGTSGGIPYFSAGTTLSSSAALAANAIVIGGGAGTAPSTTTTASGIITWIGTPSSANLRSAITDESGTGALYFQSGDLGTPTAGIISTGITLGDVTMDVTGTDATGDIYYRSAGGLLTRLAIGTTNQVIRVSAGGIPEYATLAGSGTMTQATITQPAAGITVTNSGVPQTTVATWTIALANDLAGLEGISTTGFAKRTATNVWTTALINLTTDITATLPVANGGTGIITWGNGQIGIGNGSTLTAANITGTANQINVSNGTGSITLSMAFNPTEQTLTDGAVVTWTVTNGGNAVLTNNGTGRTVTLSGLVAGYTYTLRHIQGAGGSKTVTTWTNVRWSNGTAPTLSTTAGQTDMVSFYCVNSTYLIGTFVANVQ